MFQGSIFKFDRQTETFEVWKVPDELEQPRGAHGTRILQVNHAAPESSHVDGKVWLQNRAIARVHRLDLATGEFESFEPFLGSTRRSHNLYGISPDSQNNLWFMDFSNEHIGRIDARTGDITLYETPTLGSRPRRGTVDARDRVWYAVSVRASSGCSTLGPRSFRSGARQRRAQNRTMSPSTSSVTSGRDRCSPIGLSGSYQKPASSSNISCPVKE